MKCVRVAGLRLGILTEFPQLLNAGCSSSCCVCTTKPSKILNSALVISNFLTMCYSMMMQAFSQF